MELINYIDCVVKINTSNGYYYIGKVVSADEDSITLIDKNKNRVSLSIKSILDIQEVRKWAGRNHYNPRKDF